MVDDDENSPTKKRKAQEEEKEEGTNNNAEEQPSESIITNNHTDELMASITNSITNGDITYDRLQELFQTPAEIENNKFMASVLNNRSNPKQNVDDNGDDNKEETENTANTAEETTVVADEDEDEDEDENGDNVEEGKDLGGEETEGTGDDADAAATAPVPTVLVERPAKRSRTAYFIFADVMRPSLRREVRKEKTEITVERRHTTMCYFLCSSLLLILDTVDVRVAAEFGSV